MSFVLTLILNAPDAPRDRLDGWFEGARVHVVRAYLGEALPTVDEVGAGLVVLGGPHNAYDDAAAPWLPALRELLADASRAGVPTLGICLGAQLLAVARGGRVQVAAPPGPEAGVVPVFWRTEAASDAVVGPLVAGLSDRRMTPQPTLHSDAVVDLPQGAVWLASSNQYPYQAFRIGSAWGVQFHPEATALSMREWAVENGTVDADAIAAEYLEREAEVVEIGATLVAGFVDHVRATDAERVDA